MVGHLLLPHKPQPRGHPKVVAVLAVHLIRLTTPGVSCQARAGLTKGLMDENNQESRNTDRDVVYASYIESWPMGRCTSFLAPSVLPAISTWHLSFAGPQRRWRFESALCDLKNQHITDPETYCIMIGARDDQEQGKRKTKSDFHPDLARYVLVEAK